MPYQTITHLETTWKMFEGKITENINLDIPHLADIKKLMTAVSVIDLSLHDIYLHTHYVHALTDQLLNLKKNHKTNLIIEECCTLWLTMLRQRNQTPLIIKHNKLLDGECDFRFSLQRMESDNPSKFKEIEILDSNDPVALNNAITEIDRLDRIAEGVSFAKLPIVNNTILSNLMTYRDSIFLLAKDQNNQIIGYCWGMMLRNIKVNNNDKANVFWIMDLARDPDFQDKDNKIGELLRAYWVTLFKNKNDCDFIGYQHVQNHKFHMSITSHSPNEDERIRYNNEEYSAKTSVNFNDTLSVYVRAYFINIFNRDLAYPAYDSIQPALFKAFWKAANHTSDFIFGVATFFGRAKIKEMSHSLLDKSIDERLSKDVTSEQTVCDKGIFKALVLSELWGEQCHFKHRDAPTSIEKIRPFVHTDDYQFETVKSIIVNCGFNLVRSKVTRLFYNTVAIADSPSFVIDRLLKSEDTPKEWIQLISNQRELALNVRQPSNII